MPIVTITVRGKKPLDFKSKAFAAVHEALVEIGVNERDRFLRMIELDESSFEFDPHVPRCSDAENLGLHAYRGSPGHWQERQS
jgi:hypothetical protein